MGAKSSKLYFGKRREYIVHFKYMKNTQRGFSAFFVFVAVVSIVIAGVLYYAEKGTFDTPQPADIYLE